MSKTLFIHTVPQPSGEMHPYIESSWTKTISMYKRNVSEIHTYQITLLALHPLARGWRVFLFDRHGQYEIELGVDNKRTDREIRGTHNLLNLYLAGEFKHKRGNV